MNSFFNAIYNSVTSLLPHRNVRAIIRDHQLLDVIDETQRQVSTLTVVRPEKIAAWSRNLYTFTYDPDLLSRLEDGLQQCEWLNKPVSSGHYAQYDSPESVTEVENRDDIDQDLNENLNLVSVRNLMAFSKPMSAAALWPNVPRRWPKRSSTGTVTLT